MSTQNGLHSSKVLVKADFSYYPTIMSDDEEWLVSSGYVYALIHNNDGSPMMTFGRKMYQRLHNNQTLPFQLPPMESHEAIRDFLREEAMQIIADLASGKTQAEISYRFRNCLYDNTGIFFEMRQGGTGFTPRTLAQQKAMQESCPESGAMRNEFPPVERSQQQQVENDLSWIL